MISNTMSQICFIFFSLPPPPPPPPPSHSPLPPHSPSLFLRQKNSLILVALRVLGALKYIQRPVILRPTEEELCVILAELLENLI